MSESSGSPAPAGDQDGGGAVASEPAVNLALLGATFASTLLMGGLYVYEPAGPMEPRHYVEAALKGLPFALPLMAILLVHELGHYVAARLHRVPASLPFFIPLPLLSPFGTMGALIFMPDRIRKRDALLDIGAAGPLAGLVVAIPVLLYGLASSEVKPLPESYVLEGQSLFYLAAKHLALGPIPDGSDVFMNQVAFAGWTGLLVTALNLVPVSQLDGGHIAYALFGPAWDRAARWVHFGLLGFFLYNLVKFVVPAVAHAGGGLAERLSQAFGNSIFWLVWFAFIALVRHRGGMNHPPTDPGPLSNGRRVVAVLCLVLFVLLFMPTPWARYG